MFSKTKSICYLSLCLFMGAYFTDSGGRDSQINMGLDFPSWPPHSSVSLKSDTFAMFTLRHFTWFMACLWLYFLMSLATGASQRKKVHLRDELFLALRTQEKLPFCWFSPHFTSPNLFSKSLCTNIMSRAS